MEITPGLVVGMAWWYVALEFFNYFVDALLAADAAVAFRIAWCRLFACRGCLRASSVCGCTHRTLVRNRLAVGIGSAWLRLRTGGAFVRPAPRPMFLTVLCCLHGHRWLCPLMACVGRAAGPA